MAKAMATTVPKLVRMLNSVEISGFVDGLQSARTDLAVAFLRSIARHRESIWARAASAAKKIEAKGTQPIGDHLKPGDAPTPPAVEARSITKKTSSSMGRSLGRLVANPTEHNLRVLGILAENPGRAGDLARVALGRR